MSIGERIGNDFVRAANRHSRKRDTVYLDTNAWSSLAKRDVPIEPLREWIIQNKSYLWISCFQMGELSGDTRLARPLASLLEDLPVVFLDYGQNEFAGVPWYSVKSEFDNYYRLDKEEAEVVMDELLNGPIRASRKQVMENGKQFQLSLQAALSNLSADRSHNWSKFWELSLNWIRSKCDQEGIPVIEVALQDRECYIGQRLSFAVLYSLVSANWSG